MSRSGRMASHLPVLVRAFDLSEGDILEIGTGYFSTNVLHWMCETTGRKMISYEMDPKWYERAKRFQTDFHDIIFVKDWDAIPLDKKHWGLAFIDHAPHTRRAIEIERLKDLADFIVAHDTEPAHENEYDYPRIYPLFKYRYDYKKVLPWTSVLSNTNDLKNFYSKSTAKIRGIEINLHPNERLSNYHRQTHDFFEPELLDFIRKQHNKQKVIVDVGANIGNHAIYFANFLKYEELICFEPIPDNFELLKQNLSYPNIKLFQLALSDKETTIKMTPNSRNMGASKVEVDGTVDIEAITLDSLNLKDVTLLKIDVERHEPFVLAGAKKTIDRCHPLILIEDRYLRYEKLLPGYVLEKGWPQYMTYLYKWAGDTGQSRTIAD